MLSQGKLKALIISRRFSSSVLDRDARRPRGRHDVIVGDRERLAISFCGHHTAETARIDVTHARRSRLRDLNPHHARAGIVRQAIAEWHTEHGGGVAHADAFAATYP